MFFPESKVSLKQTLYTCMTGASFFNRYSLLCMGLICTQSVYAQDSLRTKPVYPYALSVVGVGDLMLGTNYPKPAYLPPRDGAELLQAVKPLLQQADVTFGNLEGTLLDSGGTVKSCQDTLVCYAFRSPTRYVKHFKEAGFDLMSIANNHSGDFGLEGRRSTMKTLQANHIKYAGLLTAPTTTFTKDGVVYGLAAFAPNEGTCDIRNISEAQRIVRELAKTVDVVIVSFHGGAEGAKHQHVTRKTEIFYEENRGNVYNFAHAVIDAGADIIFGHGPHVTRSVDLYKDRFIVYSMGNFCTYARFNLKGENAVAPLLNVQVNRKGEFIEAYITPVLQVGEGEPIIDPDKGAIKTLQRLLKSDFPEVPLVITDQGRIFRQPGVVSGL